MYIYKYINILVSTCSTNSCKFEIKQINKQKQDAVIVFISQCKMSRDFFT